MKAKQLLQLQINTTTLTSITSILVLSTIFALLYLLDNYQYAFTQDMAVDITNNLDQSLIFNTVENRQDVQIKSDHQAK